MNLSLTKDLLDSPFQFLCHWARAHLTRDVDNLFDCQVSAVLHWNLKNRIILFNSKFKGSQCFPNFNFKKRKKTFFILLQGYQPQRDVCGCGMRVLRPTTLLKLIPFFTFFLSRGGSRNSLMIREAADGTTSILATRFWMVSLQVTFSPFQSWVALAMSSPIFFGD